MEDKIEVGEHVRTKDGIIGKVEEVTSVSCWIEKDSRVSKRNIVKHRKKLTDLVEPGDFVNGHKVVTEICGICGEDENNLYFEIEGGFNKARYIGEKDIVTILTKEMYAQNCYKVGGEMSVKNTNT